VKRDIIRIDEARCTGCSQCIPNCPEGALQVIDGKARLVSDLSCDGLGACIGHCPEDAITIEHREAEPYDERKVMEQIVAAGPNVIRAHLDHLKDHGQDLYLAQALEFLKRTGISVPEAEACGGHSHPCPGSKTMDFRAAADVKEAGASGPPSAADSASQLRQWPVQLHLLNPHAPYFQNADLLIAADCVPFSYAGFHDRFLRGKALVIFCPKLDDSDEIYVEKLAEIIKHNSVKSITVLHMEVPCCFGTTRIVEQALKRSGKPIAVKDQTVSIRGDIV
jgi:NAD-dependent dihydropyrimidine dehydrogenase PreA subunit